MGSEAYEIFLRDFLACRQGRAVFREQMAGIFRWIATHRAFRKYVTETQGVPEGQDPKKPPFEDAEGSVDANSKLEKTKEIPVAVS